MKHCLFRKMVLLLLPMLCAGALYLTPSAHAGYFNDLFDGVQEMSELPGEVNKLKEEYKSTVSKLEEAQGTMESYRQQNEALIQQNKKLTETVQSLMDAEADRQASSKRIRVLLITGAALLAGYFILLRVLRVVLRR
ncbi:hypothetical protein EJP77_09195 [Paenibacillus zeisoli]|uniref:Uncharacterized protein n=1 Tax=Paenibacillus zeisoli TaxID=2496267 RepID=A0A433XBW8_9BACL|nr:hypothetical protein [Paenibacillus zeisoli]RUT31566.1 hypothetical protein EJP77_09195 [Paenibacillus zeisoli]